MWPEFIPLRWLDLIDVLLVSILLYQLYKLVKGTVAISIFTGMLSIYLIWLVVKALNMQLLGTILGQFIGVGVITLIIVFQQELRKFLLMIGTTGIFPRTRFTESLFKLAIDNHVGEQLDTHALAKACKMMSASKTGAIIVLMRRNDLSFYVNTGEPLNANVSQKLIESIFSKHSPLHDGAIIIQGNTILAARCVLPVSESTDFPSNLGMRHRAAVGVTENSDTIAISVSEQTGDISIAIDGELEQHLSMDELKNRLDKLMKS
jgi:diadenylate cyclase